LKKKKLKNKSSSQKPSPVPQETPRLAKTARLLARIFLFGVLAIVLIGSALAYLCTSPYQGFIEPPFVQLGRGTSSSALAAELEAKGIIRSRYLFLLVRALNPYALLQAGDYQFDRPISAWDVFNRIHRGDVFYEEVRVPEGSNMYDIAKIIEPLAPSLTSLDSESFLKTANDPRLIHDLDPAAPTLEGFLFPSVYRITHQTTAGQLCRLMTDQFRKVWTIEAGSGRSDLHKVVTIASLVEKETRLAAERPLVAAVFENRLTINMPLQCDPTTVYAALRDNRYRGTIYKSDLASANPYNTYAHTGLPPGPIANPGIESIKAALHPADVAYLYFVAKPEGGSHNFSTKLDEHLHAVERYRQHGK
jgi:UPF0755 protein